MGLCGVGKNLSTHSAGGGLQSWSGNFWMDRSVLPLLGIKPWIVHHAYAPYVFVIIEFLIEANCVWVGVI